MDLKSLEVELLKLSAKEKAAITYKLLESLESDESGNIEEIWVNEALNRYYNITSVGDAVVDSELVIREAKSKYE